MTTASRTVRVFISSTFSDLAEERNALHASVFPKLRALCESRGCRFHAIDLRWGVRDEAALDQQTMAICLREIERCLQTGIKPNFLILLGDRYGWRPLPSRVPADEFEMLMSVLSDGDRSWLVWNEDQRAHEKGWYRRDDNAVPAEYVLRPRASRVPADATADSARAARDQEARVWSTIEKRLRSTFCQAVAKASRGIAAGRSMEKRVSACTSRSEVPRLRAVSRADEAAPSSQ